MAAHPDQDLFALGIRQPWAELILREYKTIEVRTVPTAVRGPVYLYASQRTADTPAAAAAAAQSGIDLSVLPRGRLVGTVEIVGCRPCRAADAPSACLPEDLLEGKLGWLLARPTRLESPMPVRFLPYGIWFYPFRRRGGGRNRRR